MIETITHRLQVLKPTILELTDDSAQHVGHAGNTTGGGHYTVMIDSPQFFGLTTLEKHQLIYKQVADLIPHKIHALRIQIATK